MVGRVSSGKEKKETMCWEVCLCGVAVAAAAAGGGDEERRGREEGLRWSTSMMVDGWRSRESAWPAVGSVDAVCVVGCVLLLGW